MLTPSQIIEIFNARRDYLLREAIKYTDMRLFSIVDLENIIDDILIKTIASKTVFNDKTHLHKYLYVALKNNKRLAYKRKVHECIPEMTNKERTKNFRLAKDILSAPFDFSKKLVAARKRNNHDKPSTNNFLMDTEIVEQAGIRMGITSLKKLIASKSKKTA